MTEAMGGGTVVQLEGVNSCCVAELQGYSAISLREDNVLIGMTNPAEGQSFVCPTCGNRLVYMAAAWRSRHWLAVTNREFGV